MLQIFEQIAFPINISGFSKRDFSRKFRWNRKSKLLRVRIFIEMGKKVLNGKIAEFCFIQAIIRLIERTIRCLEPEHFCAEAILLPIIMSLLLMRGQLGPMCVWIAGTAADDMHHDQDIIAR